MRHQNVLLREREWVWSFTETIFRVDSRRGSLWFDRCGPTKGLSTQHFNLSRCHHPQTRGERERRVKLGWKERNDTRLSLPVRPIVRGCAHTHTHLRQNTHKACQSSRSVNVHLRDSTSALCVPADVSQLTDLYNSRL